MWVFDVDRSGPPKNGLAIGDPQARFDWANGPPRTRAGSSRDAHDSEFPLRSAHSQWRGCDCSPAGQLRKKSWMCLDLARPFPPMLRIALVQLDECCGSRAEQLSTVRVLPVAHGSASDQIGDVALARDNASRHLGNVPDAVVEGSSAPLQLNEHPPGVISLEHDDVHGSNTRPGLNLEGEVLARSQIGACSNFIQLADEQALQCSFSERQLEFLTLSGDAPRRASQR